MVSMKRVYRPRHDFVILRARSAGQTDAGVVIPDKSAEGRTWWVFAKGPKVSDDLKIGQQVNIMGAMGIDVAPLPLEPDLFITKEANIILIVESVEA